MRISFTPKTGEFFVLFARAAQNALQVARLVDLRFREHPSSGITQEQVKAEETKGDAITRELVTLLNTQYLTPFDRDDIYMLAIELDDVVDELEEASDLLGLYGIELPTKHAVQQTSLIVAAAEQLAIACDNLKGFSGVQDALVELKRLEDEGDRDDCPVCGFHERPVRRSSRRCWRSCSPPSRSCRGRPRAGRRRPSSGSP